MACVSNRMVFFLLLLVGGLSIFPLAAMGLEPPGLGELEVLYKKSPLEYQLRVEQALGYGNNKVGPGLLRQASEKIQVLSKSGGDPSSLVGAMAAGTVKSNHVLVVLVDFPDYPHVNSATVISNKLFGIGYPGEYPRESLTEYYRRSSYGKQIYTGNVLPWHRARHPRVYYETAGRGVLIQEALDAANYGPGGHDFTQYDLNHDGGVDYCFVFWAGPDNGWGNFWWGLSTYGGGSADGVSVGRISWQWESRGGEVFTPVVVIHECGHNLGLPDYYHYPDSESGPIGGVGGMDYMDANQHDHNCFSKFLLGWLTPTVVTTNLIQFPLQATAQVPEAVVLPRKGVQYEYFMVQNRQPVLNDIDLPGAGLIIWHVDYRGDNTGGSPWKLLALEQADGLGEIEKGLGANAGDFYNSPSVFTSGSRPDSMSNEGSNTGARVTNILKRPGTIRADYGVTMNTPLMDPDWLAIPEGGSANVAVTLVEAPPTNVTVTLTRTSGSTNLYIAAGLPMVFTPANWNVPQTLSLGCAFDADSSNDMAVFTATGDQNVLFVSTLTVEQIDGGNTVPPHCKLTAQPNADRTEVVFDFLFDESAAGFFDTNSMFVPSTMVTVDNVPGGISQTSVVDYTPWPYSNLHFKATYALASPHGTITLTVPAGSVTDQQGNSNQMFQLTYTLPYVKTDFSDNFDGPVSAWVASSNDYSTLTTDGWKWGMPIFDPVYWFGPTAAASGSNCWGMMKGPYPVTVNAWVESPQFYVGINPVVRFKRWQNKAASFLEVHDGTGWRDVTPNGYFESTDTNDIPVILPPIWKDEVVALDTSLFQNRMIKLRFRARECAMYVDDVSVESERAPGVWAIESSPANGTAGTSLPVSFLMYNSSTAAVSGITGLVNSHDAGVTNISGGALIYSALLPGELTWSDNSVLVQLAETGQFSSPVVSLNHVTKTNGVVISENALPFIVTDVVSGLATNLLTVKATLGVTNWLGNFLKGDGGITSCIFQLIAAGSNGVADLPGPDGRVTGDDRLLYNIDLGQPFGRFGEGVAVPVNKGQFCKTFYSGLVSNDVVYVRAWEGSALENAVAYGDSALTNVVGAALEVLDFGSWGVTRSANATRDYDGDTLPDAWCVKYGFDARRTIQSLGSLAVAGVAQMNFNLPARLAVSSNFVFVADTGNDRVQVWDRALSNCWYILGTPLGSEFRKPLGIAVNQAGTQLAVADSENNRVRVFSINPTNGVLTSLFAFGSLGSGPGQFNMAVAVAFDISGQIYVADSHASEACNKRIQLFSAEGNYLSEFGVAGTNSGEFGRVMGVSLGTDGTVFEADGNNNRVQAFAGSTLLWSYGAEYSPTGPLNWVWDVQPGLGGYLYVADFNNNRIQVLKTTNSAAISVVGVYSNAGSLGTFSLPKCAVSASGGKELYVADTYNNRILRLNVTLDADGDGMDDIWEILHGLDPVNPADALQDPDGDGLLNIGEYRAGTDPRNRDTNGNGAGDGWDVAMGLDPAATNNPSVSSMPPTVLVSCNASGPKFAGEVVRITATFSAPMAVAPNLTLTGAVFLEVTPMSGAGSVWTYDYTVPASGNGAVNATVSGALSLTGVLADPPLAMRTPLFSITGFLLSIRDFSVNQRILGWPGRSGDIYHVQSSTNLLLNNWAFEAEVTSPANDLVSVTNAFMGTNWVEFYRVVLTNSP